ncbi:MAG: GH3 auxin-responsive promoter family protein [Candidatus Bathyarchaeota archaeon]|nr:GH3 auxin-responsive promoter family protein [Candidatus Bathyarchaeota archaeon]
MFADALKRAQRNLEEYETAIEAPENAQRKLLQVLLEDYSETGYGKKYGLEPSLSLEEYREKTPVVTYHDLKPVFEEIRRGDYGVLLKEKPITWVMTRGTTGENKIIPVTETHMDHLIRGGARAVLKTAFKRGGLNTLMGGVLNLQFPSNTRVMRIGGEEQVFGFSSGTYARLNPMMAGLGLVPRQEEIDALETGLSVDDWEKRYEFIYQQARDENIITIMGVAPVQTGFARYLKKTHNVYPRDIWDMKVLYTTSVAKIHTKYKPRLQKMYGDVSVIEMYTATEGAFGQQMDDYPYWRPNFDLYLFEVETRDGVKMLSELKRGEWGRLIISTPILPRYKIGDLVEAMGKNYYRVFGRDKPRVVWEHRLYRMLYGWSH